MQLLWFIGKAAFARGMRGLMGLIPFGTVLYDICADVYERYRDQQQIDEIAADVEEVVQSTLEEIKHEAQIIARKVASGSSEEEIKKLEAYLTQIPSVARQSLKRPDDPTGTTIPKSLQLSDPIQLANLLPQRSPQFSSGDSVPNASQWKLQELLGSGGFGEVWLAKHSFLGEVRAFKFCLDDRAKERLLRHEGEVVKRVMEASAVWQSSHGIVPLLDAHLDCETPWLAYEYVDGGDLGTVLPFLKKGAERGKQVLSILRQLAKVVGHFHHLPNPIVHRDLKPANILMKRDGQKWSLRITDFGISQSAAEADIRQATVSTPSLRLGATYRGAHTPIYASPQQKKGLPPDVRDDVYSLGVIGWQLLVGDLTAERPAGRWRKRIADCEVDEPILDLLESCWDDDPAERPANALDLASFLPDSRALQNDQSIGNNETENDSIPDEAMLKLPEDIVAAWLNCGARSIWMQYQYGELRSQNFAPVPGIVPGFQVTSSSVAKKIPSLPRFDKPFGLTFFEFFYKLDGDEPLLVQKYLGGLSNLKALRLSGLFDVKTSRLEQLDCHATLQALDVSATNITDANLEHIASFSNLRQLAVNSTGISDIGLRHLAKLTNLECLNLNHTRITDIGLGHLAKLTSLECLNLNHTRITDIGLEHLEKLTNLQELSLYGTEVTDKGLQYIAKFWKLRSLRLERWQVTDEGLKHLENLTNLNYLNLHGTGVTDKGLRYITKLAKLTEMNLRGTHVTDIGLQYVATITGLTTLELTSTEVTSEGLRHLENLTNLKRLELCDTEVTSEGLRHLENLTNLKTLDLKYTLVTDEGLRHLESLTKLRSLQLNNTEVTDKGLKHLANLRNLYHLDLSDTPTTDEGLKHLANLTNLELLYLSETGLTDEGLKHLANLTKLDELYLCNNQVTDEGLGHLANLINLSSLSLSGTMITDRGLEYLPSFTDPKALDISYTEVTEEGLKHLANLTNLNSLYLDGVSVSVNGLKYLANLKKLWTLHLNYTDLTDEGLKHLAEFESLRHLHLDGTKVTDDGINWLREHSSIWISEDQHRDWD